MLGEDTLRGGDARTRPESDPAGCRTAVDTELGPSFRPACRPARRIPGNLNR